MCVHRTTVHLRHHSPARRTDGLRQHAEAGLPLRGLGLKIERERLDLVDLLPEASDEFIS